MPIYEYECPKCGVLEVIQKVTDAVLTECPSCEEQGKKTPVTKLVSNSSFQLKGTGWYKTDYSGGSSSAQSAANAKKKSEGAGETTSSDTTEKKSTESKATEPKKEEKKAESTSAGETKKCGSTCGCS